MLMLVEPGLVLLEDLIHITVSLFSKMLTGVLRSVDGEDVALDLMAQLGLQVAQLLLQDGQCRHDDGLRPQGPTGLHVVKEPAREKVSIDFMLCKLT